jgi:hypothetical protein
MTDEKLPQLRPLAVVPVVLLSDGFSNFSRGEPLDRSGRRFEQFAV